MRWSDPSRVGYLCALFSAISGLAYLFVTILFVMKVRDLPFPTVFLLVPFGVLLLSPAFAAGLIYSIYDESLSLPPESNHLWIVPLVVILGFISYSLLVGILRPVIELPDTGSLLRSFAHFSYMSLLFLSIIVLHLELEERRVDQ